MKPRDVVGKWITQINQRPIHTKSGLVLEIQSIVLDDGTVITFAIVDGVVVASAKAGVP